MMKTIFKIGPYSPKNGESLTLPRGRYIVFGRHVIHVRGGVTVPNLTIDSGSRYWLISNEWPFIRRIVWTPAQLTELRKSIPSHPPTA